MSKVEDYRKALQDLEDWDSFLLEESKLPGPRANLELAFAVALEGDEARFSRYASLDAVRAPANTKEEFLAFCGVLGLGSSLVGHRERLLHQIRECASDSRWRIREAVALGLQVFGERDMDGLLISLERWAEGNLLEKRAIVAALCEPRLLGDRDHAMRVIDILDWVTESVLHEEDRKSNDFLVLKKGLGYGWSVVVAAQPDLGKERMEKWITSDDKDIRWVMKRNLKKKRLLRMDEEWVQAQMAALAD